MRSGSALNGLLSVLVALLGLIYTGGATAATSTQSPVQHFFAAAEAEPGYSSVQGGVTDAGKPVRILFAGTGGTMLTNEKARSDLR